MKKHKHLIIVLFMISIFGLGYAFLQTTLTINGVANVDPQSWNIHFVPESVVFDGNSYLESPPYFSNNNTILNYDVTFKKPGDVGIVTIDAINEGSLDAMLQGFSVMVNGTEIHSDSDLPEYFTYHLSYADTYPLHIKDLFKADSTESFTFKIEFKQDIDNSQLPSTPQTLSLSFEMEYVQADETAVDMEHVVYTYSDKAFEIGKPAPENAVLYDDREIAMDQFGHHTYMKHIIKRNFVVDSMVGFKYKGVTIEVPYGNQYYEKNISTFSSTFEIPDDDSTQCDYFSNPDSGDGYLCLLSGDETWVSEMFPDKSMLAVVEGDYGCVIIHNISLCGESANLRSLINDHLND